MNVSDCRLIDLPKFLDKRGNLSFAEEFKHIPFKIERTYWIYDVTGGEIFDLRFPFLLEKWRAFI